MTTVSEQGPLPRQTILFVDDEPLSRKYFKASIGKYANVLTAETPDTALELLANSDAEISVVVSDERMPRESGVSFLTDVRKAWPSTVRVLTSAYANIDNLQQAINDAAIYRFVPKPWDIDELCSAMREALVAERVAEKAAAPLEGRLSTGNAENANIELLAVLARECATPLKSLEEEANQLSALAGSRSVMPTQTGLSRFASWASQLRIGQIANSAARVQRDVQYCQSLASSICELATGLCDPNTVQTPSMAETASNALEQLSMGRSERSCITLDARRDFRYRAPMKIMSFVLADLLQNALRCSADLQGAKITVELVPGLAFNEVRITGAGQGQTSSESSRAIRCALWAFGGEMLNVCDCGSGPGTISIRLPHAA
jgi:two-component system probable response regulator PhcQ